MNKRIFEFPASYEPILEAELSHLGYSLKSPAALAKAVVQLSDFYIQNPTGQTPWNEKWARAASLAYYFPLNYARNQAVAIEANTPRILRWARFCFRYRRRHGQRASRVCK